MILSGKPVAQELCRKTQDDALQLRQQGMIPTLCIVRIGEDPSDLAYERGICKRAEQVDVEIRKELLPADSDAQTVIDLLHGLNFGRCPRL